MTISRELTSFQQSFMAKIGTMLSNLDSKGNKNGQLFIYGS
jgi:hypothetical protein